MSPSSSENDYPATAADRFHRHEPGRDRAIAALELRAALRTASTDLDDEHTDQQFIAERLVAAVTTALLAFDMDMPPARDLPFSRADLPVLVCLVCKAPGDAGTLQLTVMEVDGAAVVHWLCADPGACRGRRARRSAGVDLPVYGPNL